MPASAPIGMPDAMPSSSPASCSSVNLALIFPDQTYSGTADGETVIATITEKNTVFTFKCVTAKEVHTWLLEGTCLYSKVKHLESRINAIEAAIAGMVE